MSAGTAGSAVRTAPGHVLERGATTPNLVALRVLESGVWVEYGWADIARTLVRVAAVLRRKGVTSGSEVALVCGSRAEWALCVWATNALGATTVAVSSQSDEAILQQLAKRRPAMWILEGLEAADRVARCDTGDAPGLLIDDVDSSGLRPAPLDWRHEVLDASVAADDSRLAEVRQALDAVDLDTPAVRFPEDAEQVISHRDLLDADGSGIPVHLEPGGEYLAFLPPTWTPEARLLLGSHPMSGATVSLGSHVGGGLAELAAVQPTAVQAPAEWWDAVADRILRSAAEPAPLARRAMRQLVGGTRTGGFTTKLARRAIIRRMGLGRLRAARSFGNVGSGTAAVFDGLNVPLDQSPERPGGLGQPATSDQSTDSTSFEEAK